jgi:hypothetical protein
MDSPVVSPAPHTFWAAARAEFHRTGFLPDPPHVQANERLAAEITELWGHLNAATYRFLELVAEFDRRRAWQGHGLANCAQWLNWQCGIGKLAAREKVRVARALEHLPRISASFARGELSYSKVRAMTRIATAENEPDLLSMALHGTAWHVEKLVRQYRWVERLHDARRANELHRLRRLRFFYDEDGSMIIHAKLPPEVGAVVKKAIEAAVEALEREEVAHQGVVREETALAAVVQEEAAAGEFEPGRQLELEPRQQPSRGAPVRPSRPEAERVREAPGARSAAAWTQSKVSTETPCTESNVSAEEPWTESNVSAGTHDLETPASRGADVMVQARARIPAWERVETPEDRHEREHRHEHAAFHDAYGAKRADALVHLAECFLARQTQVRGSVADRYQVVVHVDQRMLASASVGVPASGSGGDLFSAASRQRSALGEEFETERALALETVRRLGCDCSMVGILENEDGEPLSVGTQDTEHSARAAACASGARRRLPLSRMRADAVLPRTSRGALGQWR